MATKYAMASTDEEFDRIALLSGNNVDVDTPLEISLLSYYSQGVINIRPVQAAEMLPANDPRAAGLKLGAAVLKELTELRFLDPRNAAAIARYEGMLQFISDNNGVSRAAIDTYYRQGISGLIAGVVDEEFGKVGFSLAKGATLSYNAVLSRDSKTGQYTLNYERPSVENDDKTLSAPTLRELQTKMSANKTDFDEAGIKTISDKAAQIPAVALNDISLNEIKVVITSSYTNPKQETYGCLVDVFVLNNKTWLSSAGNRVFEFIQKSYNNTLAALNENIASKVYRDAYIAGSVVFLSGEQQKNLVILR
jgi:hypothetical protein